MLHSINDVLISNLGVRSLKVFCTSVGIYGQRNKGKYDVCSAIVKAKLDTNFVENKDKIVKKEGKKSDSAEKPKIRVTINRRRLVNVLFGDNVRPKLADLGSALTRKDLDEGRRVNQDFYELVASEYNKIGIKSYDEDAFPHLSTGRTISPSTYQEVDWIKCRDSFKSMCNEYDICFKNWKISGFHGDIPSNLHDMTESADLPFTDFVKSNTSVLYMHQYVYQHPDILTTVTGMCCIIVMLIFILLILCSHLLNHF